MVVREVSRGTTEIQLLLSARGWGCARFFACCSKQCPSPAAR
jgi:hypothetical protein